MRRLAILAALSLCVAVLPVEAMAQGGPLEPFRRVFKEPVDTIRGLIRPKRAVRSTPAAAPAAAPKPPPVANTATTEPAETVKTEPAEAAPDAAATPTPVTAAAIPDPRPRPDSPGPEIAAMAPSPAAEAPAPADRPAAVAEPPAAPAGETVAEIPPQDGATVAAAPDEAPAAEAADAADTAPDAADFAAVVDGVAPPEAEPEPEAATDVPVHPAPLALAEADEPARNSSDAFDILLPHLRPHIAGSVAFTAGQTQVASLPPDAAPAALSCMADLASLGVAAVSLDPIRDGSCSVPAPVAVASLSGGAVPLSAKALVNCGIASTLAVWMRDTVDPLARRVLGGGVTEIRVAATYACRTRNGVAGAKMSEHAIGNAIDISAFKIEGVGWVDVGGGHGLKTASFLADVRKSACGPFTTVLGPGSDSFHTDHFHLDQAKRGKSGRGLYCH